MAILGEFITCAAMSGSIYLTNNQRLVLQCDSVVPKSVAETKAQAYADRTGKSIYIDGIGETAPTPGTVVGASGTDTVTRTATTKSTTKSTKKKA